jgi:hypothetical protein
VTSAWVPRLTRVYLWALGAGLLLEGSLLRITSALGLNLGVDPLHDTIHIVWGLVILALLVRGLDDHGAALLAFTFGVFYVIFGIAGVAFDRPLGLQLGPGENAFHFIVGPLALVLGDLGLR